MNKFKLDSELKDFLFFFPIKLSNVIDKIFSSLEGGYPKGIGILLVLNKYGPMPISKIAEKISVRKPNMTPLIDDLVEAGFIRRCASSDDRRIINIELTEDGNKELKEILENIGEIIEEKFSVLTDIEYKEGRKAIKHLMESMDKILMSNE